MIADGMTGPGILAAYPDLEGEDIHNTLRYAADPQESVSDPWSFLEVSGR
jgi:uncharacterized protein (DUF433 family)